MILIVEDSRDVNGVLCEALNMAGYETDSAYDGISAMKKLKSSEYELLILDIMLPYKSGDMILKELREFSMVPVIVISAKDMTCTKVELLKMGADDYITKPFDLDEVVARVESNLRRTAKKNVVSRKYSYGALEFDEENGTVRIDGKEVDLTQKEYCILRIMIQNPAKVFTKANLYETVWNEEYTGDDNTIKAHMSNLRNKLKKAGDEFDYIETVWGLGYRMRHL